MSNVGRRMLGSKSSRSSEQMMRWRTLWLTALASLAFAGAAAAQIPSTATTSTHPDRDCGTATVNARTTLLSGKRPYAVFSWSGALDGDCGVVAFYNATPRYDAPAIIWVSSWHTAFDRTTQTYADSRLCPGAIAAARSLEEFQPAGIKLRALNPTASLGITVDGSFYSLWSGEARADPSYGQGFILDVSGWNYPGLDRVQREVLNALKDCKAPDSPMP
jgi:hypothetical protein